MSVSTFVRKSAANSDGGAAIEFAIVAPFLIALIAGIFSVGWMMHSISSVRYALAEAGRALQLDPDMTEEALTSLVNAKMEGIGKPGVTISLVIGEPEGGIRLAQATADYAIVFSVPLLPQFTFDFETSVSVPLTAS